MDFTKNKYTVIYENFDSFKKDFYCYDLLIGGSQVNMANYKDLFSIIVMDATRQDDKNKESAVDMQVTFFFRYLRYLRI